MIFTLLLGLGCGETSPETLVDELRAMASIAEPPEVQPGQIFSYQTFFANPDDDPIVAMSWVCTNLGDGCLEAAGGSQSISHTSLVGVAPTWERELSVSPALSDLVDEGGLTATQLWTLVCLEDVCPVIDEAIGVDSAQTWPDNLANDLSNPLEWMRDLPMDGTSLAYQLITTSTSDDPHENPTLEFEGEAFDELSRNQSFTLSFKVTGEMSDQAQVYNYISGGGFKMPNTFVSSGDTIDLEGVAPKTGDTAIIWVVLVDGYGGVAVWTQPFTVK